MIMVLERCLGLPMAATYDRVRSAEQKVKDVFPDAEFVLVVGSDDALHLRVYSSAEPMRGPTMKLIGDDLSSI